MRKSYAAIMMNMNMCMCMCTTMCAMCTTLHAFVSEPFSKAKVECQTAS